MVTCVKYSLMFKITKPGTFPQCLGTVEWQAQLLGPKVEVAPVDSLGSPVIAKQLTGLACANLDN